MTRLKPLAVALAALLLAGGVASAAPTFAVSTTNSSVTTDAPTVAPGSEAERPGLDRLLSALQQRYDLTDDQVADLESLIVGMHDDGASRAEIRRAVADRLVDFGVDRDQLRRDYRHLQHATQVRDVRGAGLGGFADALNLTDDRKATLRDTVETERANGSYPAEVRTAVVDDLRAFGYTDAEIRDAAVEGRIDAIQARYDLTDEQAAEIRATVEDLRDRDAFHAEIRAAVIEHLQAFDALPEDAPGDRPRR